MGLPASAAWELAAASLLLGAGLLLPDGALRRLPACLGGGSARTDAPERLLLALRRGILGLSLLGLGLGWLTGALWLVVLSLVFAGEEMLETSLALYGLRRGAALRLGPASGSPRGQRPRLDTTGGRFDTA